MLSSVKEPPPQAIIIAGPNGSGKTTASRRLVPSGVRFVNADMIAQELTGHPGTAGDVRAGRILIERLEQIAEERDDFGLETTLATLSLRDRLVGLRMIGYQVHLLFFWLPSEDLAVQRVAERVRAGGHPVPEETIRRRYVSGIRNFKNYAPIARTWRIYDNSKGTGPELVAAYRPDELTVLKPSVWEVFRDE